MKHKNKSFDGEKFEKLVKSLSKRYRFPYSEAHLRDLAVSYKPKNVQNIRKDLRYLRKISKAYVLSNLIPNNPQDRIKERLGIIRKANIFTFFESILNEKQIEPKFHLSSNETYNIDVNEMDYDDIFKEEIINNNNVLDASVMKKILANMFVNMNNPDYYIHLRKTVASLNKAIKNRDTVSDQSSDHFKKIVPFLEFVESQNNNKIEQNFLGAIEAFLSINGRALNTMTIGEKIEVAYSILDFNPLYRDKVNEKNRPSNIRRDAHNFFYASQAEYYVTEDKRAIKKSKLVAKTLGLKVKIVLMTEFIQEFTPCNNKS